MSLKENGYEPTADGGDARIPEASDNECDVNDNECDVSDKGYDANGAGGDVGASADGDSEPHGAQSIDVSTEQSAEQSTEPDGERSEEPSAEASTEQTADAVGGDAWSDSSRVGLGGVGYGYRQDQAQYYRGAPHVTYGGAPAPGASEPPRYAEPEPFDGAVGDGVVPPPRVGRMLKGALALFLCAVFGFFGAAIGIYALSRTSLVDENSMLSSWIISASGLYVNRVEADISAEDHPDRYTEIAEEIVRYVVEITELKKEADGTYSVLGSASGVIISADGYIVTNQHVTEDSDALRAVLWDKTEYYVYRDSTEGAGRYVGEDSISDLSLIKIEPGADTELPHATLEVGDSLRYAQTVFAVGNPLGIGTSVTMGHISSPARDVTVSGITSSMIQMDASVSPGNSGGGLFDAYGHLIGIVSSKSKGEGVEGIGYAIPMSTVTKVIDNLSKYNYVKGRPLIGVTVVSINSLDGYDKYKERELSGYLFDYRMGVYVIECTNEGADLRLGDRIVKFNGETVESSSDLNAALFECAPGDKVTVTVERLRQDGGETESAGDKLETLDIELVLLERTS